MFLNVIPRFLMTVEGKPKGLHRRYIRFNPGMEINEEQRDDVLAYIRPRIRTLGEELGLWGGETSMSDMWRTGHNEAWRVLQDIESWKVIDKQLQESALLRDELLQMWRKVRVFNTKLAEQVKEPSRRDLKRKVAIDDVEEGIAKLQERVKRFKDI